MSVQKSLTYVGIDVAKLSLVIQFPDQRWSTTNDTKGHAELIRRAQALSPVQVICENSGAYERDLILALHAAGVPVSAINPRQIRDFARACGRLVKTDALDAQIIREYGCRMQPAPDAIPAEGQVEFAELVRARQELVCLITDEINRREHARVPVLVKLSHARQKQLERQLAKVDALLDAHLARCQELSAKAARLQ